jgi:hypothetical protein
MLAYLGVGIACSILATILWGAREWQRWRQSARIVKAIIGQQETELRRVLAEKTDFKPVAEWFGEPALIMAVRAAPDRGDDAVRLLISHGADVNEPGTEWKTPLMYAAAEGDLGLCALLLSHGADATAHDMFGRTAAFWAQLGGHKRIASVLRRAES